MTRPALAVVPVPTADPDPPDTLLTTRQVAASLAISTSMVRKLVGRGDLHALFIGRLPRFEPGEVRRYLSGLRTGGAADAKRSR
jgi:excisionase family DNA binding protein